MPLAWAKLHKFLFIFVHIKFKELLQGSKFKKNSDDVNADSVMNEFVNRLYAFAIIIIVKLSSVLLKKSCVSNTDIQEQRIDTTL